MYPSGQIKTPETQFTPRSDLRVFWVSRPSDQKGFRSLGPFVLGEGGVLSESRCLPGLVDPDFGRLEDSPSLCGKQEITDRTVTLPFFGEENGSRLGRRKCVLYRASGPRDPTLHSRRRTPSSIGGTPTLPHQEVTQTPVSRLRKNTLRPQ